MADQADGLEFTEALAGLGPRLGQLVAQLQLSQSEFARRVGVTPGFVSEVVRGNKRPGTEFLLAVRVVFGASLDWLLTGEGTMFGGAGINLELLRAIRLHVTVARAAVVGNDPTARALLLLIRDGRLDEAKADPALREYIEAIGSVDEDFDLATELYNGHLSTEDPAARQRNLLAAAVAHFEARKPLDKFATLSRASGATIQINIGTNQRNAGRDHRGR